MFSKPAYDVRHAVRIAVSLGIKSAAGYMRERGATLRVTLKVLLGVNSERMVIEQGKVLSSRELERRSKSLRNRRWWK
jgi:hypothetical protein